MQWLLIAILVHSMLEWIRSLRRGFAARRNIIELETSAHKSPVSIIVPAWRERGMIEQCIRALKGLDYSNWEAIILAGGPDGTYEAAQQAVNGDPHFRVLTRGPEPKNEALMRGVQVAQFDTLVFLDADCIVEPEWLAELVKPLAGGADVSLGERYPLQETWVTLAEQMINMQAYHILGSTSVQGDRSIAMKRSVFALIGNLPVHTYAREDWDLGLLLKKAGVKIAFAKKARLRASRPSTLGEYMKNDLRWRRTHLAGLWEHRSFLVKNPRYAASQLYFYLLSLALLVAFIIIPFLVYLRPDLRLFMIQIWLLIVLWLSARRAALGGEIAVYTGRLKWLFKGWALITLMFISMMISNLAVVSLGEKAPFDYKGPRQPL